jgi:hypothetical protein
MVSITSLWLPIVLSAVIVFIASSIIHMVLPYHRSDYKKLPNEEKLLEAIRSEKVAPGDYTFPCPASPKDMSSPEMMEKYKQGPVGFATIIPSGPPAMGKQLVLWFLFCLIVGFFVAYVTGRTLDFGAHYLAVFRVAGTVLLGRPRPQLDLDGRVLEHDPQAHVRRLGLWAPDGGHVRVALAPVTGRGRGSGCD